MATRAPFPYVPTQEDTDVTTQAVDDEALLRTARERFAQSEEAEGEIRREIAIDQGFIAGDGQWDVQVRKTREQPGQVRPCLTVNLIRPALKQVINEQRAARPALRVSPTGSGASQDVAKICDGLLRAIQRESRAQIAYDTACADGAGVGRGWFRIMAEYEDATSFNQVLAIQVIPNCLSVYPQPNCREPDYSDMNWCFLVSDVQHDDFLAQHPGFSPADFGAWRSRGDTGGWLTPNTVRVAEYYWKELVPHRLVLFDNGLTVDVENGYPEDAQRFLPPGARMIGQRVAQVPQVYWAKICGMQVLERTVWQGSWIPVIPVLGDRMYVDGRLVLAGLVRGARDPQRMVNFWASAEAEAVALAPRAPWVMAAGQDEGFEVEWKNANTHNFAALHYTPKQVAGAVLPPPQRNVQEPAIQAIAMSRQMARTDFQDVVGVYDASLGAPSNEKSGRAIEVRDQNADMSNMHYLDNFSQYSLYHAGRIMLELLPKIYREPGRILQLVQEDDSEKQVVIKQDHIDQNTGVRAFYDLAQGSYSVAINAGPQYATQRKESLEFLLQMGKIDPKVVQLADDLIVSQSDAPIAKELAARLKKTIPPDLLEVEGADKDTQLAMAKGQLSQVQQEAQALNAFAQQMEQALRQMQERLHQVTMENQGLKADRSLKAQELQLKGRQVDIEQESSRRELDIKEDAQVLEAQKVAVDAQGKVAEHHLARLEHHAGRDDAEHERSSKDDDKVSLAELKQLMLKLIRLEELEQEVQDDGD